MQTQNQQLAPLIAGNHPRLPYAVEDAHFASYALAHAYAAFVAEDTGRTVAISKRGFAVEWVQA